MLEVFVFTLLHEHQDKFEAQSHEAKCKAMMPMICLCLTVIGCRDCDIVTDLINYVYFVLFEIVI